MAKTCIVTAFLNLNRESWTSFSRKFDEYLYNFNNLYNFVKNNPKTLELIVYIDISYSEKIQPANNITIVRINEQFMVNNIPCWKRLKRETEIMNSDDYKKITSHRTQFPENTIPRYTLINHSKIDFVVFSEILTRCEQVCWCDFGYCNDSTMENVNGTKFILENENKINFLLLNQFQENDRDIYNNIINPQERVVGGFFIGKMEVMKEYQKLYSKVLDMLDQMGLCTDDQEVVMECQFRNRKLFHFIHTNGKWFEGLRIFWK